MQRPTVVRQPISEPINLPYTYHAYRSRLLDSGSIKLHRYLFPLRHPFCPIVDALNVVRPFLRVARPLFTWQQDARGVCFVPAGLIYRR